MIKKITICIVAVNLILAGVQLAITTLRSTDGPQLASYYRRIQELKLDNWRLSQKISDHSSLSYLEQHAEKLGLSKIKPVFIHANEVASR